MANPLEKLLRAGEGRILRRLQQVVKAVNALEEDFKELTDEERNLLQAEVLDLWAQFKARCTDLREIDDADMQGQWFDGAAGKAKGLVDETTNLSLDEYVSSLLLA